MPIPEPAKPVDWFDEMRKKIETQANPAPLVDSIPKVTALPQKDGAPVIATVEDTAEARLAKDDLRLFSKQFIRNRGMWMGPF